MAGFWPLIGVVSGRATRPWYFARPQVSKECEGPRAIAPVPKGHRQLVMPLELNEGRRAAAHKKLRATWTLLISLCRRQRFSYRPPTERIDEPSRLRSVLRQLERCSARAQLQRPVRQVWLQCPRPMRMRAGCPWAAAAGVLSGAGDTLVPLHAVRPCWRLRGIGMFRTGCPLPPCLAAPRAHPGTHRGRLRLCRRGT